MPLTACSWRLTRLRRKSRLRLRLRPRGCAGRTRRSTMKAIAAFLGAGAPAALVVAGALVAEQSNIRKTCTLEWDAYLPTETNGVVKIYGSTNLALPLTNWIYIGETSITNTTFVVSNLTPFRQFFVARSSNWWGESDFSNVAPTPPIPRGDVNLRIGP